MDLRRGRALNQFGGLVDIDLETTRGHRHTLRERIDSVRKLTLLLGDTLLLPPPRRLIYIRYICTLGQRLRDRT
jgi:hypothetical protein